MTPEDYPRADDEARRQILHHTIRDSAWLCGLIGASWLVGYLALVVYRLAGPVVLAVGVVGSLGFALAVPHLLDRTTRKEIDDE